MTQEEILEYNKRCAEFLGAKPCKDWQGYDGYEHDFFYHWQWSNRFQDNLELYSYRYSELKFHSNWNWIMEVIKAIEELDIVVLIGKNSCVIEQSYGKTTLELESIKKDSKKEAVVQAINQFLIWYNNGQRT